MRILNHVSRPATILMSVLLVLSPAADTAAQVSQQQEGVFLPHAEPRTSSAPQISNAQPPSPADAATGDVIYIETWNAPEIIAHLVGFTNDSLIAIAGGTTMTIPRARLRRVSRWRPATRKNALIGGSLGLLAGLFLPCDTCPSPTMPIILQTTLWSGVGALVGRIHGERETLYGGEAR
jgi:hypothetical protein